MQTAKSVNDMFMWKIICKTIWNWHERNARTRWQLVWLEEPSTNTRSVTETLERSVKMDEKVNFNLEIILF